MMIRWKPDAPREEIEQILRTHGCPYWREPDSDNAKLWLEAAFRLNKRGTQ
jgi:hypothetical protein